ncbi:MAG: Stp1/IreP family PP2C-type Ser/Thr phosphatase [bacterium]|nr:Stp1/IreP family PP2C-type Ser/Thr phosphatase [bacterium]
MTLLYYGLSDVGHKREKNEDSLLINDSLNLFIVADGMGGHLGGEQASRIAVKTIEEVLKNLDEDPDATMTTDQHFDVADMKDRLKYSIQVASARVFEEAAQDPNLRGMGTTVVLLWVHDGKGYIANVGDSRAYLVRGESVRQLTTDHSLVNEQLQAGFISREDARNHKLRNIITRSVGFQEEVDTDVQEIDLEPFDRILLCSDGLTNRVDDKKILEVMERQKTARKACEKLIEKANKNGGDDNITTVVVQVAADDPEATTTLGETA